MLPKPKSSVLEIEQYVPGRSKTTAKTQIKLSSNENSLGASPLATKALQKTAKHLFRYPEGSCLELRNAISHKFNLHTDRIVCGAGSDEIFAMVCNAFLEPGDEIIQTEYAFLMYKVYAKINQAIVTEVKELNLKTDIKNILSAITPKTKLIFVANPNNPTGTYIPTSQIIELLNSIPKNVILVLDHAYEEYVVKDDYFNCFNLSDEFENLVITKTFSKIYGLASLRIGYCYTSKKISQILNRVRGPFNVSAQAQACATAAVLDEKFIQKSIKHNLEQINKVKTELSSIGVQFVDSVCNFILINCKTPEAAKSLNSFLFDNGVIVRSVESYKLPEYLRITIGTKKENQILLSLLKKFFQKS